jgi:hypothetical protein
MYELSYIDMPDEFTRLLRVDMTSKSSYHNQLQTYVLKHPSLKGIINRILNNGQQVDINSHIKKIGWHGIRDRVLCYYVNFAENREHARTVNLDLVEDITNLEKSLRFSTVSGYSRLVLYGFFLRLSCLEEGLSSIKEHKLYPNKDIVELLKTSKERIINIDHLILLLHHLIEFFGRDQLFAYVQSDFSFESLYLKMDSSHKKILAENFLTYCSSIDEDDIFVSKVI